MALRVNLTMDSRIPASELVLYGRGAVLNGNQNLVNTFVVHAGHDFEIGHKFLYALMRTNILTARVFTVTSYTVTTVAFDGAPTSGVDKAWLVPLGIESGGVLQDDGTFSRLNYDGTTVAAYQDPNGDDEYPLAHVPIEASGESGWWQALTECWAVAIDTSGKPLRAYPIVAPDPSLVGGGGSLYGRGPVLPGAGDPDNPFFIQEPLGSGAILWAWMKQANGDYDWQYLLEIA